MMRWLAWALLAGSAVGQGGDWKPPTAQPAPVDMPADGPPARSAIAAAVQQGVTAAMVPVIEALRDLRVQMASAPAPVAPVVAAPVPGPTNPIPWEAILAAVAGIASGFLAKGAAVNTVRRERGPPRKELAAAVQQQAVQGQPVVPAVTPVAPPGFRLVPVPEEVTP